MYLWQTNTQCLFYLKDARIRYKVLVTESLKFVGGQNPTLNTSVLVDASPSQPRWVGSPLINSQQKLNSIVGGLKTSKGGIRNRELSFATPEEIQTTLGKQGVMNYKRITIRKGSEKIQTHILAFNTSIIPQEVKAWYCLKKVEQYIYRLLRSFKCYKYGHHK